MHLIGILLLIALSSTAIAEEERILNFDALDTEAGIRRSVEEAFPSLHFGFYHWTGNWIIGALEDFDHERVLLILPSEGIGEAQFDRNGERLKLPPGEPATLKVAGVLVTPQGRVNLPEGASDRRIGYWVQLRATDRAQITVKLTDPAKGEFLGTYDPDNGWQTSCAFREPDQSRKNPADAYEISRDSLLKQVRAILRAKKDCIVRLKSRIDLTVRMWPPAEVESEPLWLILSDKIEEGRKELTPQELKRNLEVYCDAAMAAQTQSHVRISVRNDTDDKLFRTTLTALAEEHLGVVYLDEYPSQVFDAKLISVQMLSQFRGKVKVVTADPRFVMTLELLHDVEEFGKKGETVNVAIHSPARDLHLSDYETSFGKLFRFRLSQSPESKTLSLQREVTTNAQQGVDGKPPVAPQSPR